MKIDREKIVQKLSDTEYDTIELSEIRDILENGCRGYREFSDEELVESFREWFDFEDIKDYLVKMEDKDYDENNVMEMYWFVNHYKCKDCDVEWEMEWDCTCEDECPKCNSVYTPYKSVGLDDE